MILDPIRIFFLFYRSIFHVFKMKSRLHLPVICILFSACFLSCDADHGNYSFIVNGKTYEIVKDRKTWPDAAAYAAKRGARLAEIKEPGEQDAIYHAITCDGGVSSEYSSVKDGGGIAYVWIGASDKNKEGEWIWDGANAGKGQNFWNGQGANGKGNGTAVNNAYVNWGGAFDRKFNEPDNYDSKQNAAAIGLADWPKDGPKLGQAGEWNDIDENNRLYFVIEYNNK
jgi:hypothetical protein